MCVYVCFEYLNSSPGRTSSHRAQLLNTTSPPSYHTAAYGAPRAPGTVSKQDNI